MQWVWKFLFQVSRFKKKRLSFFWLFSSIPKLVHFSIFTQLISKSKLTILRPDAFRLFFILLTNSLRKILFNTTKNTVISLNQVKLRYFLQCKVVIFLFHSQLKCYIPDLFYFALSTMMQYFSKLLKKVSFFQHCFYNFTIKPFLRCAPNVTCKFQFKRVKSTIFDSFSK